MTKINRSLLLAALLAGASAPCFAQSADPAATDNADTTVVAQDRDDHDFPWGLLGLLGLGGLAGLRRRDHEVRRDERMPTAAPVGTQSRMS